MKVPPGGLGLSFAGVLDIRPGGSAGDGAVAVRAAMSVCVTHPAANARRRWHDHRR